MCQDRGASINGVAMITAQKANTTLQRLKTPMGALLGNGDKIVARHKTLLKCRYGNSIFTLPCYVLSKL